MLARGAVTARQPDPPAADVQRIVQRHGGEIRARSQVGVGSIFEFTLAAGTAAVTRTS